MFVDASSEVLQKEKAEAFYKEQNKRMKRSSVAEDLLKMMEEWKNGGRWRKERKKEEKKGGGKPLGNPPAHPEKQTTVRIQRWDYAHHGAHLAENFIETTIQRVVMFFQSQCCCFFSFFMTITLQVQKTRGFSCLQSLMGTHTRLPWP